MRIHCLRHKVYPYVLRLGPGASVTVFLPQPGLNQAQLRFAVPGIRTQDLIHPISSTWVLDAFYELVLSAI